MRYFKIPLCPKFEQCEKTKMPLGAKTTQTDSDRLRCKTKIIFVQNLINDSCKPIEKTQGQIAGTKMGSFVGNDQNTLLYDLMQKLRQKQQRMQLKHSRKHSEFESIRK